MRNILRKFIGWLIGNDAPTTPPAPLPEVERDIPYGSDPLQKLDAYRPAGTLPTDKRKVAIIVHGGGWQDEKGGKANAGVIADKLPWLLAQGYVVVSINYRLYTATNGITPLDEAKDVLAAIKHVQARVAGVDPNDCTLIGHSAGAHLVALVATWNPPGIVGVVCLDSGCFDVQLAKQLSAATGNPAVIRVYAPFGDDPSKWASMSPIDCIDGATGPWLIAYSTQRGPADAKQASAFAARVQQFGGTATVAGFDLSHGDMGAQLGLPGPLTDAVDGFLGTLGVMK